MQVISLNHFKDNRGVLTVIEKVLPFVVERIFFLHDLPPGSERGRHGHFKTKMALVATTGEFKVRVNNGNQNVVFELKKFENMLLLNPEDWHVLYDFSPDCVVTVFASEEYDQADYFYAEPM